jgi:hypothetical protein
MPTEPVSASGITALSTASAMGVTAAMIEAHFDPFVMMLAFAGAVIGAGLAKPGRTKLHDAVVFLAVCLGSAQLGHSLGPMLARSFADISDPGRVTAFVLAALFHPAFNALAGTLPGVLQKLLERFGIKGAQP